MVTSRIGWSPSPRPRYWNWVIVVREVDGRRGLKVFRQLKLKEGIVIQGQ